MCSLSGPLRSAPGGVWAGLAVAEGLERTLSDRVADIHECEGIVTTVGGPPGEADLLISPAGKNTLVTTRRGEVERTGCSINAWAGAPNRLKRLGQPAQGVETEGRSLSTQA